MGGAALRAFSGLSRLRIQEILTIVQSGTLVGRSGSAQGKTDVAQLQERYEQSVEDNHGLRQENSSLRVHHCGDSQRSRCDALLVSVIDS